MEDASELRRRADEHRAAGHKTADLWESVIRLQLAARYDELAARREGGSTEPQTIRERQTIVR
jgi:hypothetical protein